MSFNLYFAGARNKTDEVMLKYQSNRLLSFVNEKSDLKNFIKYRKEGRHTGKLFIDSGAYSAHTKGIDLNVDNYIKFLNDNAGLFTCIAQLDTIPGEFGKPKTIEQLIEAPIKSWENYNYMRERMIDKDNLLPIFHQGEDFKHLVDMLETTYHGAHIPYIGISPANDLSTQHKTGWIDKVFAEIQRSSNKDVCTHAFGMTSRPLLKMYPWTSADSTSWIQEARFGKCRIDEELLLISDRLVHKLKHYRNCDPIILQIFLQRIEERGFDLELLESVVTARAQWNVIEWKKWADSYEYKGTSNTIQKRLF